jgi:hypothetical protein
MCADNLHWKQDSISFPRRAVAAAAPAMPFFRPHLKPKPPAMPFPPPPKAQAAGDAFCPT